MKNKKINWTAWVARIWSIPLILYALMMIYGNLSNWLKYGKADPYAVEGYPFIENIPPIFILLAVIGLAVAFKFPKIGGIINIAFIVSAATIIVITRPNILEPRSYIPLILMLIVIVPGVLFLISTRNNKK
jgi:hypothetical protein